jgi:hypothetical protein
VSSARIFLILASSSGKAAKEDAAAAKPHQFTVCITNTAYAPLRLYDPQFGGLKTFFPHSAYLLQYLNMASGYDRALSGNPGSKQNA